MIEVRYQDRTGNRMFQYALGRILAENLGYELQASGIDGFPHTFEKVTGKVYIDPVELWTGQMVEMEKLDSLVPRKIILEGWFQQAKYYVAAQEKLKEWFYLPEYDKVTCDADLVLHIRRTDYVLLGWALPFEYYESIIKKYLPEKGKLIIVTDNAKDWFFRRFKKWNPIFSKGSWQEDFVLMMKAPVLGISASSFSWWAGFLGAGHVVMPSENFSFWGQQGIRLAGVDRFETIEVSKSDCLKGMDWIYQRVRSYQVKLVGFLNQRLGTTFHEERY
jgi:hypothetical protein